jgi:hypothetical protein
MLGREGMNCRQQWRGRYLWIILLGCTLITGGIGLVLLAATPPAALAQVGSVQQEAVYLDAAGFIQAVRLSPTTTPNYQSLWYSPAADGPWSELATGDFNGDGDDEIVAVRAFVSESFNIAIYDPVVAPGSSLSTDDVEFIGTVPWRKLKTFNVPGDVVLVTAGDFDPARPGDEILYSYRTLDPDTGLTAAAQEHRLQILRRASGDTDGTVWEAQTEPLAEEIRWDTMGVGNLDLQGAEEVVLTGDDGYLHLYRINGSSFELVYETRTEGRPWTDAAIGQVYLGGPAEVVATRKSDSTAPRLFVFSYDAGSDTLRDAYSEFFSPSPDWLFLADISANGDDEIFMLRESVPVPPSPTPAPAQRPHLIMRNLGNDTLPIFEATLDTDNGYQAGVGGDIDGDGRAEVMVARSDRLRAFYQPEANPTPVDHALSTNARSLTVGNIDRLGNLQFATFVVTPSVISAEVPAGSQETIANVAIVSVQNNTEAIDVTVGVLGDPGWLNVTADSTTAPVALTVSFNTYGLKPLETYAATLVVSAGDDERIINSPLAIPVSLRVTPGLYPQPTSVWTFVSCADNAATQPVVKTLTLSGLFGVPVTAELVPANTDWVTMTLNSSLMPTSVTLTFDPAQRSPGTDLLQAQLAVHSQTNQGEALDIAVPVALLCERTRLWMPLIGRQ